MSDAPAYKEFLDAGGANAANQARQILDTTRPFRAGSDADIDVLDVGCGYGYVAVELARRCRRVVGIEPSPFLAGAARRVVALSGLSNVELRPDSVEQLDDSSAFDLVVLDNVLEHLPRQDHALSLIVRALRPGGLLYIVVPNKLWPIEVHYFLPFLSYLPLPLANRYLRLSGRGTDYTDASYAPTYRGLNRLLRAAGALEFRFVLPSDLSLTQTGNALHYRIGAALLRRVPALWTISKAFLVVAVKRS